MGCPDGRQFGHEVDGVGLVWVLLWKMGYDDFFGVISVVFGCVGVEITGGVRMVVYIFTY